MFEFVFACSIWKAQAVIQFVKSKREDNKNFFPPSLKPQSHYKQPIIILVLLEQYYKCN